MVMEDWFRTAFGEEYLRLYAHRDEAEAAELVDLILNTTGMPAGARVLDAPCGAGRHMRVFEKLGHRAFGFDLSPELLRDAARNGTRRGTFARADLRQIPFKPGSFDLVVNLFSSLGYFPDDATNLPVIEALVGLCRPGGWLVVDFMNSEFVVKNLQPESYRELSNGEKVHDRRWIGGEPARVNKETRIQSPDGREKILRESVRLFSPEELRINLERGGLRVDAEFGDYQGKSFDPANSSRIILMGQRRD